MSAVAEAGKGPKLRAKISVQVAHEGDRDLTAASWYLNQQEAVIRRGTRS